MNGKEVSFELLYNIIGKRFHQCLSDESKVPGNLEKYHNMSDYELVHQVCRKERLTFYNFLRMNAVPKDDKSASSEFLALNEEQIKEMINREYQFYFKRPETLDVYRGNRKFFKGFVLNELNRNFKVEFQSASSNYL